ncbi:MAG: response regulator [Verrucomicrobiota bacterium]
MSTTPPPPAKILVVDDEVEIRQVLQEVLTHCGYQVISAVDGRDALPLTLTDSPDLIITDIRMPRLDGLTLCRALRTQKDTAHIPVLILTSGNTPEQMEASLKAGADDFLPKPLNVDEIKIRVRTLIRFKRASDTVKRLQKEIAALQQLQGTVK